MTRIILTGVPGSGKTSILKELQKILPDVSVINFGDFMLMGLNLEIDTSDRDRLLDLIPYRKYKEIQLLAAKKIVKVMEKKRGTHIIDTHFSINSLIGLFPGLHVNILSMLKPDLICILERDPHIIYRGRLNDIKNRKRVNRKKENIKYINHHQQLNRIFGVSTSIILGCYLNIIDMSNIHEEDIFINNGVNVIKEIILNFGDC